jgi:hypothetical protein
MREVAASIEAVLDGRRALFAGQTAVWTGASDISGLVRRAAGA